MKSQLFKRVPVLALAAALTMTVGAGALFGWGSSSDTDETETETETENTAPTAWDLKIKTYRDIACQAQFSVSSLEEGLTFAIEDQPRKGTVVIDGSQFTYTPDEGVTGSDSFTYTVTDSAGQTSKPATVKVEICKIRSGVTYADTADTTAAAAAQDLAEAGVFTGVKIGDQYYFEPEKTVTRSEFLAMVMEAADCQVTSVTMTGFADDDAIPTWAKAYAAAGVAEGIIQGVSTAEGAAFQGDAPITFNEAATVLNRVLDVADVELEVWYADREAVPSWAAQAVGNMEAVSVLSAGSFGSDGLDDAVTRADAAQMISAAMTLLEGDTSTGLLSWLS